MQKRTRRAAGTLAALAVTAISVAAPASMADPSFGPGNKGGGEGNSGPQGAKSPAGADVHDARLQVGRPAGRRLGRRRARVVDGARAAEAGPVRR